MMESNWKRWDVGVIKTTRKGLSRRLYLSLVLKDEKQKAMKSQKKCSLDEENSNYEGPFTE